MHSKAGKRLETLFTKYYVATQGKSVFLCFVLYVGVQCLSTNTMNGKVIKTVFIVITIPNITYTRLSCTDHLITFQVFICAKVQCAGSVILWMLWKFDCASTILSGSQGPPLAMYHSSLCHHYSLGLYEGIGVCTRRAICAHTHTQCVLHTHT